MSDDSPSDGADGKPVDALTAEPPRFEPGRASVLTPEGQIQSAGAFARGLGARRVKAALFVGGGGVLVLALLIALFG